MTVGEVIRTPEERAMGLLFKLGHTLTSRDAVERGGATIVGTGTTFGPDGMTLNGSGNLLYNVAGPQILRATLTIKIEFTLGFAPDDGIEHYFWRVSAGSLYHFSVLKGATNALILYCNGVFPFFIAYATWSAALVAGKNTLTISTTSGVSSAWLNGTLIDTSATAWTAQFRSTVLAIGASHGSASRFIGTIHSFEIYGSVATSTDEPHLRDGSIVSDIDLDKCLAYLPGKTYYRNDAGLFVTDVGGRIGGTALMGSDGATAAAFPKVAREAGLVRGFSFDGGDQVNMGDDDRYSFTDGAADKPFSLAMILNAAKGTSWGILGKGTNSTNGEWWVAYSATGSRLYFGISDSVATAYIGRYGTLPAGSARNRAVICTYDGSGLIGGIRIYVDFARFDDTNALSGVYVRMRNTAMPVTVGAIVGGGVAGLIGSTILPSIWDKELSPLQVKALTARLLRLARTP